MQKIQKIFLSIFFSCLFFPLSLFSADTMTIVIKPTPPVPAPSERIELAFVLDTTGSMSGLIEGAKKKIWSIANAVIDQNPGAEIRVGLVGYRDLGDEYVTKSFPLTTDVQTIYGHLLAFRATGGGDTPESVNEALDVAVTTLGWSDPKEIKADRILFLVGDAPPHMDYEQDRKYPEVIRDAVQRGIIVNTVQAGDMRQTTQIWQEMARLGRGEYLSIPQDGGKVIVITTPYDVEIHALQHELNLTIIPYGSRAQQSDVKKKSEMYEAAAPGTSAEMSSYVNKAGKGIAAITGSGDLVADMEEGKTKLDKLSESELPPNLQKMSPEEREAYIAEQSEKRAVISKSLAEKVRQRDAYIRQKEAEAPKGEGDSFDRSVSRTLGEQIGKTK